VLERLSAPKVYGIVIHLRTCPFDSHNYVLNSELIDVLS